MALQTIYIGTDTASGQTGTYIAWFSDSDACNDGTRFGSLSRGFVYCYDSYTILGHTNITFTGCNTGIHGSSYPNLPTGVNDLGVPALKCADAKNPPSAPEYKNGRYETCIGGANGGIVNVVSYCK